MPYHFASQPLDSQHLASGRVFYSHPGHPALPIRLTREIFERALARRAKSGQTGPPVLYDPCCGSAYHLATLAFGHWQSIQAIIASDVDPQAVQLAARNLALLTPAGMEQRMEELREKYHQYNKESYQEALISAETLHQQVVISANQHPIHTHLFQASAFDGQRMATQLSVAGIECVDLVLTDVPYGQQSRWQDEAGKLVEHPMETMLKALLKVLHAGSIVAIVLDKQQKVKSEAYKRLERFQIGKRQIVLLKPLCAATNSNGA